MNDARPRSRRGSVLLESILVMPLLFFLFFSVVQFAQIWTARQMLAYAAFAAARAVVVVPPAEQQSAAQNAAELVLSWINVAGVEGAQTKIPGWGEIPGSGSTAQRVTTSIVSDGASREVAVVTVKYKFPLMIPAMMVNRVIANLAAGGGVAYGADDVGTASENIAAAAGDTTEIDGWPYLEIKDTCVVPMPNSTVNFPSGGYSGANVKGGS